VSWKGIVHKLAAGDRDAEELNLAATRLRPGPGVPSHVPVATPVSVTRAAHRRRLSRSPLIVPAAGGGLNVCVSKLDRLDLSLRH
jgi:hypothetical protein